ncbi:MAG: hypothetical protein AB1443_03675 [Pseudomonadota bacterium]
MSGLATPTLSERKVLLALREGFLDPRLLAAARNLCQRLGAGLDILLACQSGQLPAAVADLIKTLRDEGVAYNISRYEELRRRDVVQYANTHECIATVVIDSLEGWESVARSRSSNPWKKLACPLVTAVPAKPEKERS